MNKKQIFLDFIEKLINANPDAAKDMPEEAKIYLEALKTENETDKPLFTDNGKLVLQYMKDNPEPSILKARDIAEGLGISSRSISGSLRKLVNDGFVEKVGKDPVLYSITQLGKDIEIQ